MTKEEATKKIKQILAKDPMFHGVKLKVTFKDKKHLVQELNIQRNKTWGKQN